MAWLRLWFGYGMLHLSNSKYYSKSTIKISYHHYCGISFPPPPLPLPPSPLLTATPLFSSISPSHRSYFPFVDQLDCCMCCRCLSLIPPCPISGDALFPLHIPTSLPAPPKFFLPLWHISSSCLSSRCRVIFLRHPVVWQPIVASAGPFACTQLARELTTNQRHGPLRFASQRCTMHPLPPGTPPPLQTHSVRSRWHCLWGRKR